MIKQPKIKSLLGRLSANFNTLESKYSDFVSKCELADDNCPSSQDNYSEIRSLIVSLKQSIVFNNQAANSLKEYLALFYQNHLNQSLDYYSNALLKAFEMAKMLRNVSVSSFDNLLEVIPVRKKFEIQRERPGLKNPETKALCPDPQALSIKLKNPQKMSLHSSHEVYSTSTISKINTEDSTHRKTEIFPYLSLHNASPDCFNYNENVSSLYSQIFILKEKLKQSQEKEILNLADKNKLEQYEIEIQSLNLKINTLQGVIKNNQDKLEELLNIIKENKSEKEFVSESFNNLKNGFRDEIQDFSCKVHQLEQENLKYLKKNSKKLEKISKLKKENTDLLKKYTDLQHLYENTLKNFQESNETIKKYSQTLETELKKAFQKDVKLKKYKESILIYKNTLYTQSKEIDQLKDSHEEMIKSLKNHTDKCSILILQLEALKSENQKVSSQLLNQTHKYNRVLIDFEALETQNQELLTALAEQAQKYKALRIQVQDLEAGKEKADKELSISHDNYAKKYQEIELKNSETCNNALLDKENNKMLLDQIKILKSDNENNVLYFQTQLEIFNKSSKDTESQVKNLENALKQQLIISEKLEKENESLLESQKFISDYANSIAISYTKTINDLKLQISNLESKKL